MADEYIRKIVPVYQIDSAAQGWDVVTDKQRIRFYLLGKKLCCETHGVGDISSNQLLSFRGTKLIGLVHDNTFRVPRVYYIPDEGYNTVRAVSIVILKTSKGNLPLVLYNVHNKVHDDPETGGEWKHSATFVSEQLVFAEDI